MDNYWRKSSLAIALTLVLFVGAVIAGAQVAYSGTTQINKDLPLSKQAKTKPISNTLITLEITFDNGEVVEAAHREGGMIRITRNGKIIGLTSYITNQDNNTVAVKLFRIDQIRKGEVVVGEGIEEIETLAFDSTNAVSRFRDPNVRLTAQILSIQKESNPKPGQDSPFFDEIDESGDSQCCVNCNDIDTCACRVRASCGRCCSPPCCN